MCQTLLYLPLVLSSFVCDRSPSHGSFLSSCPTVCIKCQRLLLFIYSCDALTFSFFDTSALFLSLSHSLSIVFSMFRYVNAHPLQSRLSVCSVNVTFTRTTHLLFFFFFYFHFYFSLSLSPLHNLRLHLLLAFLASPLQVLLQLSRAITRLCCVNTCVIKSCHLSLLLLLFFSFSFLISFCLITHLFTCASPFPLSFYLYLLITYRE